MSDDGSERIARVVTGPDGGVRLGRINEVLAGTDPEHRDLRLALLLSVVLVALAGGASLAALSEPIVTVASAVAGFVAAFSVGRSLVRLRDHGERSTDLAVEELQERYARGEMDLETFQRRVDRVHEEGPEVVFGDDEQDPHAGATDGDPEAILQRRLARGDLSEAEYRSRVAALEETGVDVTESADEPDPERAGE
jgi:uncharacterized membrane protein